LAQASFVSPVMPGLLLAGRNGLVELVCLDDGAAQQNVEMVRFDNQKRGRVGLLGGVKVPFRLDLSKRNSDVLVGQLNGALVVGVHFHAEFALHVACHEVLG
jgi:hypothetical protein